MAKKDKGDHFSNYGSVGGGTGGGYTDTGGIMEHKVESKAGKNGIDTPASGAFKLYNGPSSAKNIKTPMESEKEDDRGNPSCFYPSDYE